MNEELKLKNRLKEARAEANLSQAQLAEMVGVSRNTISSIETEQFSPTAKLALILCIALNKKFEELIKYVDLVLLDIKHIDNEKHIELTTKSNKNALEFAKFLSNNNVPVWIRHVLVPTINTQKEYLIETRKFIDTLTNVKKVEILPYHTLGISKYEMLNIPYLLKGINPPSKEEIELAKSILIKE